MRVRSRGRALSSAAAALTLTLAVAGCGGESEEPDGALESPTNSTTTSPAEPTTSGSPAESPSADEESTSPGPTEQPPDSGARKLSDLTLSAGEVPGFNDEFTWQTRSQRMREGRRPFGTCQKFAMTSIGATKVTVRRYTPAPRLSDTSSTAANLVASFADEKTAKRAYEVLKSWRSQCDEELKRHDRREVGKLQSVELPAEVPAATADWYLLVYGPAKGDPDAGYFDAQGMVRVGKSLSMLKMRLVGQDYNYEAGQEPMVGAVRASAGKLAG